MDNKQTNEDFSTCRIDLSEYETVDETPILEPPSPKNRKNPPLSPTSARSLGALAPVIFSESDEESEGPTIDLTESQPIKTESQPIKTEDHESRYQRRIVGSVFRYLQHHYPKRLQELHELKKKNVKLCDYCFAYIHQVIDDHPSQECPHRPQFGYNKPAWVDPRRKKKRRDDPEWLAKHPRTGTPRGRFAKRNNFGRRLEPQLGVGQSLPRPFVSPMSNQQQPAFCDRFGSVQHSGGAFQSPPIGAFHRVQFNSALQDQQFGGAFQSLPQGQQFGGAFQRQQFGSAPQQQAGQPSYGAQFPRYGQNQFGPSHSFAGASLQYPQYVLHQEYFSDALVDRLATEVGRRLCNSQSGFAPK